MNQNNYPHPELAVLDLDELTRRCTGRLDLVERILAKFSGRFPADLDALEQAAQAGNLGAVTQIAHRVKGASASVAAHALRALAAQTEEHARHGRQTEVFQCMNHLRREWTRFQEQAAQCRPCQTY